MMMKLSHYLSSIIKAANKSIKFAHKKRGLGRCAKNAQRPLFQPLYVNMKSIKVTKNGKTTLSPIYDFLNSTIAIKNPNEEIALTMKGKKSNLKATDFIDYYAKERLQLNEKTITIILEKMKKAIPAWKELLKISFLSDEMKLKYLKLLETRIGMFE